jgi:hypothetical protein
VLQVIVVQNHMSGKDTHIRGLRVLGPQEYERRLICWVHGLTHDTEKMLLMVILSLGSHWNSRCTRDCDRRHKSIFISKYPVHVRNVYVQLSFINKSRLQRTVCVCDKLIAINLFSNQRGSGQALHGPSPNPCPDIYWCSYVVGGTLLDLTRSQHGPFSPATS